MRTVLAGFLTLGMLASAAAQQPGAQPPVIKPPRPVPAQAVPTPPPPAPTPTVPGGTTSINEPPPKPPAMPVPDGPVVKKQDLEGGLIAEDIRLGEGAEVKAGATVVAYYHGTLKSDGSVFDSAYERSKPYPFSLENVIQGWQKGVPGIKVGGVRRLTVPSALAYGPTGSPPKIPANADLVFVIEVIDTLRWEDLKPGDGDEVWGMCVAVTTFSAKDKDGKEVDKADAAHPYAWIPGEINPIGMRMDAMQNAMKGMKVGGKRRVHVPADLNEAPPMVEVKRPQHVQLDIEVELLSVRNLAPKPVPPPPAQPAAPTTPAPAPAPTGAPPPH